jgi:Flp pilus assembly protein TadG
MRLNELLKGFHDCQQGVVAIIVALSLSVILGFAALTIDIGYLYFSRAQLQTTADAAALAGVEEIPDNDGEIAESDIESVVNQAQDFAEKNLPAAKFGNVLAASDVVPGHWDASGEFGTKRTFYPRGSLPFGAAYDAVQVTVRRAAANDNPLTLFFARLLNFSEADVSAVAVAYAGAGDDEACILSLHPSNDGAIEVSGTNDLDLDGCGIALHSDSPLAAKFSGTVDLAVSEVCVKGDPGVDVGGAVTYDPDPPEINAGCEPPADPLSEVVEPAVGACNHTDFKVDGSGQTLPLQPGTYCNGIEISGSKFNLTFAPGEYILKGGGLKVSGSQGTITGEGVVFYNGADDGGAFGNIDFSGSKNNITFSAPASGTTYAGILFFEDRSADPGDFKVTFAGSDNTNVFDGVIYTPDQEVEFSGGTNITGDCGVKIIASTVKFNGNSAGFPTPGEGCAADNVSIPLGVSFYLVL